MLKLLSFSKNIERAERMPGLRRFVASLALALAISPVILTLSACNYFLGPKASESAPIQLKASSSACVRAMGPQLKAWISDGSGAIGESVDCAVKAIDQFTAQTEGQGQGVWTRSELANFIKTYFAANAENLELWIDEALRLKQSTLGGAPNRISQAEILRLRSILVNAKSSLVRLSPVMNIAAFRSNESAGVSEAKSAIEELAKVIGDELENSSSEDRPVLAVADVLSSLDRLGIETQTAREWLPLAQAAKAITLGGDKAKIAPLEWPRLFRLLGRAWSLSLRYKYELASSGDLLGTDINKLEHAINDGLALLNEGITAQNNSGRGIENALWTEAFAAAEVKGLIPGGIKAATLSQLLPATFSKILYGNWKPNTAERAGAFGLEQLTSLRALLSDWIAGQKVIFELFPGGTKMPVDEVVSKLSIASENESAVRKAAREHVMSLLNVGRPLVQDDEGRLLIRRRALLPSMARKDLDLLNGLRVGIGSLVRGYAHDAAAVADGTGLLESEVQEFYLEARSLGRDLNLIDIRNWGAGTRTFMEASIFTSVSDGNLRASLREMIEWFQTALSAGFLADRIHARMVDECGTSKIDVMGRRTLKMDCFRRRFRDSFATTFTNIPGLSSWYAQDTTGERATEVQVALENAARSAGTNDSDLDSSELRAMIPVLHYTEAIFANHDSVIVNDQLDTEELWNAFPILQPFIRKMGNGRAESETIQRAIFSYLLVFGEPPPATMMGGGRLIAWSVARHVWSEEASRLDILKVMASFAISARQTRAKRITDYYDERRRDLRAAVLAGNTAEMGRVAELFQCPADAVPFLMENLRTNLDQVLPTSALSGESFISKIKRLIEADQRLERICLPF